MKLKPLLPFRLTALAVTTLLAAGYAHAANSGQKLEPWQQAQKTEVWEPVPPIVEAPVDAPPSDAVILFGGDGLSQWEAKEGGPAKWAMKDDAVTVVPGAGDIRTKRDFCDVQLHVEWRTPTPATDMEGQERNNSGVFLQERYEVQVLDSYRNKTYPNGQAASVYKQHIPLVNATRPPGTWQSYDIVFTAPRFDDEGKLTKPAYVTVLHNGVLVQNHVEIEGTTEWIGAPKYEAHGCAPIALQDHGNQVSFRNIWVREL